MIYINLVFLVFLGICSQGFSQTINESPSKNSQENKTKNQLNDKIKSSAKKSVLEENLKLGLETEVLSYLAPYIYESGDRRSIFEVEKVIKENRSKAKKKRKAFSLSDYELEQIQLVGIMWNVKFPKALFAGPNGKLWPAVGVGSKFQDAYIAAVREGEVIFMQKTHGINEKKKYRERVMKVQLEK